MHWYIVLADVAELIEAPGVIPNSDIDSGLNLYLECFFFPLRELFSSNIKNYVSEI